ncbi:MAG: [protein-PII] uridylyltransferase [Hyphomicrobiales bacterium]|nr:MAG: [protein-PII] uridylyltransferase [Hyphomicrobiales bacterium]
MQKFANLIDSEALREELAALTADHGGDGSSTQIRAAVLARLKTVFTESRAKVETLLQEERKGTICAERLCFIQDELIRVIYDFAVRHVYRMTNPSSAERMSVVAVGGYGRGTMAPFSDVDLLFVLPYKQTPWGESVVEYILYLLWDLGLKVGHATRTVDECIRLARSDMTIRTAVLEARYLWGDKELFEELIARFDNDVAKNTGAEFISAKLAERDDRHKRQGQSRYLVEPNVKEGKGGLRDLNTLFWIAKYYYRVRTTRELPKKGVFSRSEYLLFKKCEEFLWAVRCNLHFVTGRAEERLSFGVQRDIAARLGYTSHAGLRDVERFMKHYFLMAKHVGDLTRIICASLEEEHVKTTPRLNRLLNTFTRRRRKLKDTTDFVVDNDRITIADEEAFTSDPVNIIRIFNIAVRQNLAFHPDALKLLTRSLKLIDARLRENAEANQLFLEILTAREGGEIVLRLMHETGVLGRFVPDFGKIVAMMQFNMYHHYTVCEHLLHAMGALAEIDRGDRADEHPLATELFPTIQNRRVLYLAMFLHDIAKGRPEDHSVAGKKIARRLAPRLGFSPAETETVAWLVEHHLTMSMFAQQRDLGDRKTIEDFAAIVQSPERLKLLLILTVADIRAVGPGVWNGWKGQLLRTLYYETETVLGGGHSTISRSQRVSAAKDELAAELANAQWSQTDIEAYRERHYPPYWLRVDLPRRIKHAAFINTADKAGESLATAITPHAFEGVTEITVLAPDHPRVLSTIAGACTIAGANIVDAQIFTTSDGLALDSIFIRREFEADTDEERRGRRIAEIIEAALSGREPLPEIMARKLKGKSRTKAFQLPTDILVNNTLSDRFTVIEASGLDRPGLLYDLTRAMSDLNLDIGTAHIATFGERAVDVFYVSDLTGQKITNPARKTAIQRRLEKAFSGKGDAAEKKSSPRPAPSAA